VKKLLAAIFIGFLTAVSPAQAVELTFYYPIAVGGPLTKVVDNLVAGFQKEHPDVKINAVYAGNYDDARIKALAALRAGQPAQMSVLFPIDLYELLEQDVILPFDDIAGTPADKAWLKSFYPALMANGTYKGKVYGIPFQRSTVVMYWNKEAFKEAGLDANKPPQSWAELKDYATKLTKKDASGKVTQWGVQIPSSGFPYWLFQTLTPTNDAILANDAGN